MCKKSLWSWVIPVDRCVSICNDCECCYCSQRLQVFIHFYLSIYLYLSVCLSISVCPSVYHPELKSAGAGNQLPFPSAQTSYSRTELPCVFYSFLFRVASFSTLGIHHSHKTPVTAAFTYCVACFYSSSKPILPFTKPATYIPMFILVLIFALWVILLTYPVLSDPE